MESAMLSVGGPSTKSVFLLSKSLNSHSKPIIARLNRRFSSSLPSQLAILQLRRPASLVRVLAPSEHCSNTFQFSARYAASSASGGDASPESGDVSAFGSEVIVLAVGGMTCGGCAASVKKILESQPQVSSATVNLTTETAIVWPVSEAKVAPNWKKDVGEVLAKHLTNCGFSSNLGDI